MTVSVGGAVYLLPTASSLDFLVSLRRVACGSSVLKFLWFMVSPVVSRGLSFLVLFSFRCTGGSMEEYNERRAQSRDFNADAVKKLSEQGLSQRAIAEKLSVSRALVQKYLRIL